MVGPRSLKPMTVVRVHLGEVMNKSLDNGLTFMGIRNWSPWVGCHKVSEGCVGCWAHADESKIRFRPDLIATITDLDLYPPKTQVPICPSSDFFLEEADPWRDEVWRFVEKRPDIHFIIPTKRPERFDVCVPPEVVEWAKDRSITFGISGETQKRYDDRVGVIDRSPFKHNVVFTAPILEFIDLKLRDHPKIDQVVAYGDIGSPGHKARMVKRVWLEDVKRQCVEEDRNFIVEFTGSNMDGHLILDVMRQRREAPALGLNHVSKGRGLWAHGLDIEVAR